MNTEMESLKLGNILRNLGYKVDIEMQRKKLKKSLEYANKENIPYITVFGENEVQNGIAKFKNMKTGEEYSIDLDNILMIKEIF